MFDSPAAQSFFPGFESPSAAPGESLHLAVFPDADAALRIDRLAARLRLRHGLQGRPLGRGRFHVSLHHLGDFHAVPRYVVDLVKAAASGVAAPPFEVAFDRALSLAQRPQHHPYVLAGADGTAALRAFQRTLVAALGEAGLRINIMGGDFMPHITLLYDGRRIGRQNVEEVRWTVREFALLRSVAGRTGYIPLGRWPLASQ